MSFCRSHRQFASDSSAGDRIKTEFGISLVESDPARPSESKKRAAAVTPHVSAGRWWRFIRARLIPELTCSVRCVSWSSGVCHSFTSSHTSSLCVWTCFPWLKQRLFLTGESILGLLPLCILTRVKQKSTGLHNLQSQGVWWQRVLKVWTKNQGKK